MLDWDQRMEPVMIGEGLGMRKKRWRKRRGRAAVSGSPVRKSSKITKRHYCKPITHTVQYYRSTVVA